PIGLLNTAGYYDKLLGFLKASVEQQFLGDWQMDLIRSDTDPVSLLKKLVEAAGLSTKPRLDEI
ncbi:MAG: LOG family protein, partial [Rhodoferax sp.]|nr:LOG family protein [Rhodoferax sp.]